MFHTFYKVTILLGDFSIRFLVIILFNYGLYDSVNQSAAAHYFS